MTTRRTYLPAGGWDWFLPMYDPYVRLLGWDAVRSTLLEQMDLAPGQRVLDIGCATGTWVVVVKQLHPDVAVVGLDPDPKALARAARKALRAGVRVHFDRGFSDQLPSACHAIVGHRPKAVKAVDSGSKLLRSQKMRARSSGHQRA